MHPRQRVRLHKTRLLYSLKTFLMVISFAMKGVVKEEMMKTIMKVAAMEVGMEEVAGHRPGTPMQP